MRRATASRPRPPRERSPDTELILALGPERLALFAESLVERCVRMRVDVIDLHSVHYTVASAFHAAGLERAEAVGHAKLLVRRALLQIAADDSSFLSDDADPSARDDTVGFG